MTLQSDKHHRIQSIEASVAASASRDVLARAIDQATQLSKESPNDPDILLLLGDLFLKINDHQRSRRALEQAVHVDPDSIKALHLLARCLIAADHWKDAVPYAKRALDLESGRGALVITPQNIEAVSVMATSALYDGNLSLAAELFVAVTTFIGRNLRRPERPKPSNTVNSLDGDRERQVHPIVYLPVEVKAREFEAKCLLALLAVKQGLHAVIGRSWVLGAGKYADLPPGVVVFKTLNARDADNMALAANGGGHLVVAIDEEAFGRSTSEHALRLNVDPLAVERADQILIQGQAQLESWQSVFPSARNKMMVTGNPKLDLFDIGVAQKRSGEQTRPLILFCTMSGNINPSGRSYALTIKDTIAGGATDAATEFIRDLTQLMVMSARFEVAMVGRLTESIQAAAKAFPEADIVVRPHPIENADLWRGRFKGHENVRVETDGALTEWLSRCTAMVHVSGCGSGVEAALYGVPAVRLMAGDAAEDPDTGLSSELNLPATAPSETVDVLRKLLSDDTPMTMPGDAATLSTFLFRPDSELVAESAIRSVARLRAHHSDAEDTPLNDLVRLKASRTKRFQLKPFHLQKFPDTSVEDVVSLIHNLAQRFNVTAPFTATEIEDGLFLVSPDAN